MQSPILRDFEDSARRSGYNPLLVDAMVKVESTVYLIANAQGRERIVDEAEYKKLTANEEWKNAPGVTNPIDGPDTLLTVGPDLAHRLGLSKSIAKRSGIGGWTRLKHRGRSAARRWRSPRRSPQQPWRVPAHGRSHAQPVHLPARTRPRRRRGGGGGFARIAGGRADVDGLRAVVGAGPDLCRAGIVRV